MGGCRRGRRIKGSLGSLDVLDSVDVLAGPSPECEGELETSVYPNSAPRDQERSSFRH